MADDPKITFRPVERSDVPMLAGWLSEPHVQPWFHGGAVDVSFVTQEFAPVLASSTSKRGFLICVDGQEIGFAETYRVEDHREFFAALDVEAPGTAGCDLFIGETEWVGRGIGTRVIRQFTADLVLSDATVTQAIAAPDLRNEGSQRAFARAGYQRIFEAQVPGDAAPALVMRADRDTIR